MVVVVVCGSTAPDVVLYWCAHCNFHCSGGGGGGGGIYLLVSSPAHFRPPFCNGPKRWSGDYGRLSQAWKSSNYVTLVGEQ